MTEADIQILSAFLKTKPFLACKLGDRISFDGGATVHSPRQGVSEYVFTPSLFSKIYAVWCPLDNFPIDIPAALEQQYVTEITDNPQIIDTDQEVTLLSRYSWDKAGFTSQLTMDQYRAEIIKDPNTGL